jgi:hypothetical protein
MVFDHRFQNRSDTEEDFIRGILDRSFVGCRESRVARDVPEKDVGIEEDSHGRLFPLETLEDILRKRCVEIVRDGELARSKTEWSR